MSLNGKNGFVIVKDDTTAAVYNGNITTTLANVDKKIIRLDKVMERS